MGNIKTSEFIFFTIQVRVAKSNRFKISYNLIKAYNFRPTDPKAQRASLIKIIMSVVCMMKSLTFHLLLQIDCANLLTFLKGDDLKLRGWMVKQILMRSALNF